MSVLKKEMVFNFKGQVIQATFSCNLSRNNVALQVVIVCCLFSTSTRKRIFVLQKVETGSIFCNMEICCVGGW